MELFTPTVELDSLKHTLAAYLESEDRTALSTPS